MGQLVKQKHLNLYQTYTEQLIEDLSSVVYLYSKGDVTKCPNCNYDPVHKCSSGIYNGAGSKPFNGGICPVCNGDGTIYNETETPVNCTVNWGRVTETKEFEATPPGEEEDNVFKIKTLVAHYDTIKAADYITVDGVRTELVNIIKRGLKDNIVCVAITKRVE